MQMIFWELKLLIKSYILFVRAKKCFKKSLNKSLKKYRKVFKIYFITLAPIIFFLLYGFVKHKKRNFKHRNV